MRTRRRNFATPLVIVAGGGLTACGSSAPQIRDNPPPPRPPVTEWTVYKADGTCFAVDAQLCPVPTDDNAKFTCTTTSQPYQCPELLSLERPIVVVRVGDASCEMKQEMPDCPVGAACNPPPPQPLACPTE
jgi:hypothetical protein